MKKHQAGEVILAVMVVMMAVMMAVVWQGSGHVGKMEQGGGHAEQPAETEKKQKAQPSLPPASNELPEPRH